MRRLLLALALLPGCTLIDQNTFNPQAGAAPVIPPRPAAPAPAAPEPGPPPLLTIRPEQMAGSQEALRQAVAAARKRRPGVAFDVVAVLPGAPSDDVAQSATRDAADVARRIVLLGVPQARVQLAARPVPAALAQEVRIYVR